MKRKPLTKGENKMDRNEATHKILVDDAAIEWSGDLNATDEEIVRNFAEAVGMHPETIEGAIYEVYFVDDKDDASPGDTLVFTGCEDFGFDGHYAYTPCSQASWRSGRDNPIENI